MMMNEAPIKIREMMADDRQLIYSSWIKSLRHVHPYCILDRNWFSAAQHALISCLMERSDALIACDNDDDGQIYGYVVYEPKKNIMHWVYVKQMFRNMHVGTRLAGEAFKGRQIICSIKTPSILAIAPKWNITFRTYELCRND